MITNESTTATTPSYLRTGSGLLIVLGIVLIAINLRASITAVGPLIGAIRADTGLSSIMAGLLTALPLIAFAVLSPLAPKLARRFGMEYTLLISMVALTAGIVLRSVPSVVTLFVGTAIIGMAIAVCNVLLPSLIKRDFPNRIGFMTGVYSVSMTMWAALSSGVSVPIAEGYGFGWRGGLVGWAVLSAVAVVAWLPKLHSNHQAGPAKGDNSVPWHSGLAWQVTLFMGLQSLGFYTIVSWLPEILYDRGMSMVLAGWMLSLAQFVSITAMFIMPVLAGRRPSQRRLVVVTILFLFSGYLGLFGSGNILVMLSAVLIGLGQGASMGLALTFIGLRTANASQAAVLSGMAQSIGYLLAAFGPILFGFLYDWTNAWTVPLLVLISTTVLLLIVGLGAARNAYVSTAAKRMDT